MSGVSGINTGIPQQCYILSMQAARGYFNFTVRFGLRPGPANQALRQTPIIHSHWLSHSSSQKPSVRSLYQPSSRVLKHPTVAMDPSSVLPVELLSKIFHHYLTDREIPVQSFDFSDGLWVLGKVSSAWRSTANSSKSLWSTITITKAFPTRDTRKDIPPLSNPRVLSRKNATERRKQILTEILSRSGDYPLIISISFPLYMQHREVVPTSDYWPLCTILAAHSHRWQAMELEGHPYLLNDFIFTPSFRLQSLRKLHAIVRDKAVLGQVARLCPAWWNW